MTNFSLLFLFSFIFFPIYTNHYLKKPYLLSQIPFQSSVAHSSNTMEAHFSLSEAQHRSSWLIGDSPPREDSFLPEPQHRGSKGAVSINSPSADEGRDREKWEMKWEIFLSCQEVAHISCSYFIVFLDSRTQGCGHSQLQGGWQR